MRIFLDDPEGTVRRLVTTQYRVPADKLLRCGEQSDSETTSAGLAASFHSSLCLEIVYIACI